MLHPEPRSQDQVLMVDVAGLTSDQVRTVVTEAVCRHTGSVGLVGGDVVNLRSALDSGARLVVVDGVDRAVGELVTVVSSEVWALVQVGSAGDATDVGGWLEQAGVDLAQVVFEVGPGRDVVAQARALMERSPGSRVGACLNSSASVVGDNDAGWELGALTALFDMGVATIRNADPVRVQRVEAVLDALAGAGRVGAVGEGGR